MNTRIVLAGLALVGAAVWPAGSLVAHEGDPKALDKQPPYRGPGYRAARGGGIDSGEFPSSGVTMMEPIDPL